MSKKKKKNTKTKNTKSTNMKTKPINEVETKPIQKEETKKVPKNKKKQKKPIDMTKLMQKIVIWLMLFVMVAFFVATIVWGLN